MKSENSELAADLSKFKPGLIFDADGVCLFGKHQDEMSAWRSKRRWVEVLHDYFLLELERDYDIEVISDLHTMTFAVSCTFSSACGRYAFWRLINHQAPEAEKKLGGLSHQPAASQIIGETPKANSARTASGSTKIENETWIVAPIGEATDRNNDSAQILKRLLKIFQ